MNSGRATLKDVAESLGVSIKTVSRVINDNRKNVSEKTREKVLRAVKELHYRPNLTAKRLRIKKSNTIGYIIPDFTNQFYGYIFNGISKILEKSGYNIIVINSFGSKEKEERAIDTLISNNVEGIILASTGLIGDYVKHIMEIFNIPFIVIDNKLDNYDMNYILHDNINGAKILTDHLIRLHKQKRIAFISSPINETTSIKRFEGYKKSLKNNKISFDNELVGFGKWDMKSGYDLTLKIFSQKGKPDSIFNAGTIMMAGGALKALRKLRLNVPKDIKFVSFDNMGNSYFDPDLTTLNKVEEEMGVVSAKRLIELILNKDYENYIEEYIPMRIVVKGSCGCKIVNTEI